MVRWRHCSWCKKLDYCQDFAKHWWCTSCSKNAINAAKDIKLDYSKARNSV